MAIQPGQMLAHYRVSEKLGQGGMGEVWKATDTSLEREVAIKVLPESFASDDDRLARFSREAKLLASLNHPHIAAIYGLDQESGIRFLAMEYMDGEDLTQRLKRGPLPVNEAIEIADQIADALSEAHDKGIIHRDLKPANVMLLASGGAKVLDFGLAKALDPETGAGSGFSDPSMSPTLTAAMGTQAGLIMGTAGYMSPEQARGKPLDRRCDVWSFGVVLFEMLTGERLFSGETATDVIAAVVTREPDWSKLPSATPVGVRRLLKRCLDKDSRRRLRDLADGRHDLREGESELKSGTGDTPANAMQARRGRTWLMAASGLVAGLALATVIAISIQPSLPPAAVRPTWSNLNPPENTEYVFEAFLELSPDGQYVTFAGEGSEPDTDDMLWIRDLETEEAHPIRGTEGAEFPFWSPDSRSIAFFADEKLRVVAIDGGVPTAIADSGGAARGGHWSQDDTIYFVPDWNNPVFRVPASGGTPEQVTTVEKSRLELSHRWPHALPDGKHFLYYVVSTYPRVNPDSPSEVDASGIYLGSLDGSPARLLHKARSRAMYFDGSLLYVDNGVLLAQPFSLASLSFTGPAAPLAERVTQAVIALWGGALFSISDEGSLLFVRGAPEQDAASQLVWRDRQGKKLATVGEPGIYKDLRLSHDNKHVAFSMLDPADIWLLDLTRDATTRFTFDPGNDTSPRWSPDDSEIIFVSSRLLEDSTFTPAGLFQRQTAGLEKARHLLSSDIRFQLVPTDWSPDGGHILLFSASPNTGMDLLTYSTTDNTIEDLLVTEHDESGARFSPDGKWFVYHSNETGTWEIYVQSFPPTGGKWQISSGGGLKPVWAADSDEIFFSSPEGGLMACAVETANGFRSRTPTMLFQATVQREGNIGASYDVSADAQRFLMMEPIEDPVQKEASVTLIRNWPSIPGLETTP
jgi:serine/threonine protein kinase/Tol biopolymer transport system component